MFSIQDSYYFTPGNYNVGHEDWFTANPQCPNHKAGVPFSSAFADPSPNGQVPCAECFLHSTIVQTINPPECQHLHACSSCASCYSHNNDTAVNSGTLSLSPAYSANGSPGSGISTPFLRQASPHVSQYETGGNNPKTHYHQDERHRRSSFAAVQHQHGLVPEAFPHSYSNPSSRTQTPEAGLQKDLLHQQRIQIHSCNSSLSPESTLLKSNSSDNNVKTPEQSNVSLSLSEYDIASPTPKQFKRTKNDNSTTRKRSANDLCEVCGDRASGYHYNALTCEGCKGFFRRSINRREPLDGCKYGGTCEMDTYTRRKCPECRLKKCKAVGMLEECLLTEIQCRSKRRNRNKRKNKETNVSAQQTKSSYGTSRNKSEELITNQVQEAQITEMGFSSRKESLSQFICSSFLEYSTNPVLVNGWISYFHRNRTDRPRICDLATAHIKVLVEFTKKLPGFSKLNAEDQIGLLKGSVVEIGLLRNSHNYNVENKKFDLSIFLKDSGLHEEHFRCILDFFSKAAKLGLDSTEYGLLSSIVLFDSDHAYTNEKDRIDKYREVFLSAMKNYSEKRKPKRTQIVAKILNLITEMRTLYSTHAQMVSNVSKKGELSDLLREVWDVK